MDQKVEFIRSALKSEANMTALCNAHGISRTAGYNLLARYRKEGWECLKPKSKKPCHSPLKTPEALVDVILKLRTQYPQWGCGKLRAYLLNQGYKQVPSKTTVNAILKRYGRITAEASARSKAWIRFEHENPNDLWQLDFKGQFLAGKKYCYPLTLLDDHSRFLLTLKSCANQVRETVQDALIEVFRTYGLPRAMTMDNGAPWGYSGRQLHTKLSAWMIRLGIIVSHSRPGHPQTQGKLERLHRTFKEECLERYYFDNLQEAQRGFDYWREEYNCIRPHHALGYDVPIERYQASTRPYPEELKPIEYSSEFDVRKVQQDGLIYYRNKKYRVGKAFYGEPIGLKADEEKDGIIKVYYCHQKVYLLDLNNPAKL